MTIKDGLIELLGNVVATNVVSENSYQSRMKGFVAELDFPRFAAEASSRVKIFPGCYIVPTVKGHRSFVKPVLFSAGTCDPSTLVSSYKKFALIDCKKMFFFKFEDARDLEQWTDFLSCGFPSPPCAVFSFDSGNERFEKSSVAEFASLFSEKPSISNPIERSSDLVRSCSERLFSFCEDSLFDLYLQRLVFDRLVGCRMIHGLPSDIDFVAFSNKLNSFVLLEIKEKDLSRREPRGFGMDTSRITDLKVLQERTGMKVFYIVRQVADQVNRRFLNWRSISLDSFDEKVKCLTEIQGGDGMGIPGAAYPTLVCPEEFFATVRIDTQTPES